MIDEFMSLGSCGLCKNISNCNELKLEEIKQKGCQEN